MTQYIDIMNVTPNQLKHFPEEYGEGHVETIKGTTYWVLEEKGE